MVFWRVSAAWANKIILCNARGIAEGCGAICCQHMRLYPSSANDGVCFHLGEEGCKLTLRDRPIKCLLYPFIIKEAQKEASTPLLVVWIYAVSWTCKLNRNKGALTILEHLRPQLTALFGEDQYERVFTDVIILRKDSYFEPSERLLEELERELAWERDGKTPEKRSNPLAWESWGSTAVSCRSYGRVTICPPDDE